LNLPRDLPPSKKGDNRGGHRKITQGGHSANQHTPSIPLILLGTKDGRKSCGEMIDFFRRGVYHVSLKRPQTANNVGVG